MSRMVSPQLAKAFFRVVASAAADPTATALVTGHEPAGRSQAATDEPQPLQFDLGRIAVAYVTIEAEANAIID